MVNSNPPLPPQPGSAQPDLAGWGRLTGVGVGPGDPDLITVKAVRRLQTAAVVAYPAGLHGQPGVAEQIIAPWLRSTQRRLPLQFPYVQDETQLQQAWSEAAAQVCAELERGRSVVFASEGDISFYSTFTYLAQAVTQRQPKLSIESIPGICSPLAAAAALGLPLTVRSQQLAILPALYDPAALVTALTWAEVVVLMKVSSVYGQVWELLRDRQLLDQAVVIERATQTQQIIHRNLVTKPDLKLPYFSLMVIYRTMLPSYWSSSELQ